ncbi:uncharacterized protein VP01_489g1 [Puccinia sorghi]|uniref:Uncharacterized protein n=1 Tax=Puccinia sorghi TaxID=27349 RepID=A0A0L6UP54_9BASI|nr:uncharacterized protein VP01_489g1 [Puccinia sorghi]
MHQSALDLNLSRQLWLRLRPLRLYGLGYCVSSAAGHSIKLGWILANLAWPTLKSAWPIAKPRWAHANPDLAHAQVAVSQSQAWLGFSQASVPWLVSFGCNTFKTIIDLIFKLQYVVEEWPGNLLHLSAGATQVLLSLEAALIGHKL